MFTEETYTRLGRTFTRFFIENTALGVCKYTYSHEAGVMRMDRAGLYRPQSIMDRGTTPAAGSKPAKAHDVDNARAIAKAHFAAYKPRK